MRYYILLTLLLLFLLGVGSPALAGKLGDGIKNLAGNTADQSGLSKAKLDDAIKVGLKYVLTFMSILGVIGLCYGGFTYITAFGNEKKAAVGKQAVVYSVIGLVIIALSALIVNSVITLFGA